VIGLSYDYSLIGTIFNFPVPAGAFFLALISFSRRKYRLTKQKIPFLKSAIPIIILMLPSGICWLIVNIVADNLHNEFMMPVRTLESVIIFNLAATGLLAVMLAAMDGLVELCDRYRKAPQA
jgi:hypothetical protein